MEKRIIYLGDIHGNFNLIKSFVKRFNITNAIIIQVGDFGIGFKKLEKEKAELDLVNEELVKRDITVYAIRGNHDKPEYFENDPFGLSNIKMLPDYTVLNINDKNILCIGGAVSIDRWDRKRDDLLYDRESYWETERFNPDYDRVSEMRNIDIVVTHTAPSYCEIDNSNGFGHYVESFMYNDDLLRKDLIEEREQMDRLFAILTQHNDITHHYYGHFHRSATFNRDGIIHRLLNIGEFYEEY